MKDDTVGRCETGKREDGGGRSYYISAGMGAWGGREGGEERKR